MSTEKSCDLLEWNKEVEQALPVPMSIYQSNTYRSEICWLADYGGRFG